MHASLIELDINIYCIKFLHDIIKKHKTLSLLQIQMSLICYLYFLALVFDYGI